MSSKTILVTGATGFVGRHLCVALRTQGYLLRMMVRREPEMRDPLRLLGQVVQIDGEDADWGTLVLGVDVVVHLAGRAHVIDESVTAVEQLYHRVNVEITRHLAQAAADTGVKQFIFISSVKAVGERGTFDQVSMPAPEDAYGRSKLAAEDALMEIVERADMQVIVLRPPLIYGPGVGANFLRLLRLVDCSVPLPLASVDNRRSMLYIDNLVSAIARCLEVDSTLSGRYFVSDGDAASTSVLIRDMAKALNRPSRLWPFPIPLLRALAGALGQQTEIARLTDSLEVDDAPFRNTFHWEPSVTMREGLRETIQWYRSHR